MKPRLIYVIKNKAYTNTYKCCSSSYKDLILCLNHEDTKCIYGLRFWESNPTTKP